MDLNTEVIAIQQGTEDLPNPSVTLANGDILYADMLIGTDGCESMVRNVVLGQPDCPRPGGLTVYTGVVDGEGMLNDPELRPYLFAEQWTLWMGEHRCFCGKRTYGTLLDSALTRRSLGHPLVRAPPPHFDLE